MRIISVFERKSEDANEEMIKTACCGFDMDSNGYSQMFDFFFSQRLFMMSLNNSVIHFTWTKFIVFQFGLLILFMNFVTAVPIFPF